MQQVLTLGAYRVLLVLEILDTAMLIDPTLLRNLPGGLAAQHLSPADAAHILGCELT